MFPRSPVQISHILLFPQTAGRHLLLQIFVLEKTSLHFREANSSLGKYLFQKRNYIYFNFHHRTPFRSILADKSTTLTIDFHFKELGNLPVSLYVEFARCVLKRFGRRISSCAKLVSARTESVTKNSPLPQSTQNTALKRQMA